MHRLVSLSRTRAFFIAAFTIYFFMRMSASVGHTAGHFPDSASYSSLTFVGANERFWAIPLVYSVFTSDSSRIFIQVVIGTVAWATLAVVLSRTCKYSRTIVVVTLILGLSPQIIRYDLAILSESLGISFAVLAVALTLQLVESHSANTRLLWSGAIVLCVFTRPTHLILVIALLFIAILSIARSKGARHIPFTIALSCLLAWGLVQLNGNRPYSTLNFYTVMMDRIVPSSPRYEWFIKHGMPDVPGVRESVGYDFRGALEPALQKIVKLPQWQQPPSVIRAGGTTLAQWVVDHGWSTYAKYLATHPSDSWSRISDLRSPTLAAENDDFLPLDNGSMQTRSFFMPWRVWATSALFALAYGALRPTHRKRVIYIAAMAATTFALYAATLLTAGIEHQRHIVTVAVLVRVLALAAIVGILPQRFKPETDVALSSQPAS